MWIISDGRVRSCLDCREKTGCHGSRHESSSPARKEAFLPSREEIELAEEQKVFAREEMIPVKFQVKLLLYLEMRGHRAQQEGQRLILLHGQSFNCPFHTSIEE